jgi:14-3-3 protein epsilon
LQIIKDYKDKIEAELLEICNDILSIIADCLVPRSTSEEAKVFYWKMKGDYHRYLSEFQSGEVRAVSSDDALKAYQAATRNRFSGLAPNPPYPLGSGTELFRLLL